MENIFRMFENKQQRQQSYPSYHWLTLGAQGPLLVGNNICLLERQRVSFPPIASFPFQPWMYSQSTYICRVQSSVWPLSPPPPTPFSTHRVCPPGGTHSLGGEGVVVNILEDARHWIGLLQYNPSTDALYSNRHSPKGDRSSLHRVLTSPPFL